MPGAIPKPFPSHLLGPRHWGAWLGLGMAKLIAMLPYPAQMWLGRRLGALTVRWGSSRRKVADRNLALCFPDLPPDQHAALLEANLRDMGLMAVEFALGWMTPRRAWPRVPTRIEGLEHLQAALATGRGAILVGGHFSHLEIAARMIGNATTVAGMYRRMDSEVFEWAVLRARLKRYAYAMFEKDDLRGTVRHLKQGGTLWYAPDQDMRSKDSRFVPFFGVPAATITATHHLARMSNALVLPFQHQRLPDNAGYVLRLGPPLENFPSQDVDADTARINLCIEQMVRKAPEQYLWVHKRFKTRPPGEPGIY
ncbi:LpxL/LpxP family Kdo(2)-lipid IV(A) lauroyl/palmitoleoyl acyltransferase [Frateuria aurantia]|uniref:Lipid A biosynthesis acyltransferase n=1 Tax=Frateuria aurantia (strain ATCC 33424 / DSM 6220 / KCTC 2777 / LMG 1558 / NBRC 3245 / NCIMB 13370) TaxID=767434 RepID=H8L4E2_FRAAD|nr:LpxL/LpxP family Kdo(2)-lipid IV(A) lauroyl/palmitoleoyl acyltransferase [Frateuria aurantia]AFC84975.1 lipid A biosynthesis lauroyl/palmitoleoyl acyltransferase [Frateuria aurantia DSM 6220]